MATTKKKTSPKTKPKRGRPPRPASENMTQRSLVRMTAEDESRWMEAAAKCSPPAPLSSWIRWVVNDWLKRPF
jgi:hypothetical protein